MQQKECSIHDIAQEAKVSTATVSRVFSNYAYVSEKTRKLVMSIAQKRGYQPKVYQKHSTMSRGNALVGIVIADWHNPFFLDMIDCAERVLAENGINIILCNSNESSQKEIYNLSMLKHRINGLIISPVSEIVEYNVDFLRELNASGTPVILLDRDLKGIGLDGVFQDNYDGAVKAVEALIMNGHRHIATIAGPISSKPGLDRLNGYMEALRSNGLQIRQEYIGYGDFKTESGYHLMEKLIKSCPSITAVFCANNMMAIGALQAIHSAGMTVPQDISFISYGTLRHYDIFNELSVTELVQPIELMGEEAAQMMLEKLNGKKIKRKNVRRVTFEGRLVSKGSELYPVNRKNKDYINE